MEKTPTYNLVSSVEIRFADPISSLDLNNKYLVIGTMMGRISVYSFFQKKDVVFTEHSTENIAGIQFDENDDDCCSIIVGDDEVLHYQLDPNNINTVLSFTHHKIHQLEADHNKLCENSFTMLHKDFLFRISLAPPEESSVTINNTNADYDLKNIKTYQADNGIIEMTNYSVPLDFNGERFVWVEFLSELERHICVYSLNSNNNPWKYKINKDYGHISHIKLLPHNQMLIIRNLTICEIRCQDDNFTFVRQFKHIGDEVIAIDCVIGKVTANEIKGGDRELIEINKKEDENKNKQNSEMNKIQKIILPIKSHLESIAIITLDVDGNVNYWEEKVPIKTLFNLYQIKEINQEEKDKQFFSMGYPYYIKIYGNYFAISSDHGCYVIQKTL